MQTKNKGAEKIYYKVVAYGSKDDSRLLSYTAYKGFEIQYYVGEFVYPQNPLTKLFVFESLWSVRAYHQPSAMPGCIYECHVINPVVIIHDPFSVSEKNYLSFWETELRGGLVQFNKLTSHYKNQVIGCDAVKLLRKAGY